jgi:hypothetical protein
VVTFKYLIMGLATVAYSKVLSWHASIGLQEISTVWSITVLEKRRIAQLFIKIARVGDCNLFRRFCPEAAECSIYFLS